MKAKQCMKCLLACLGVLLVGLLSTGCDKLKQEGGSPQGLVPEVAVVSVRSEALTLNAELSGRVSAFLVAEVRPQVNGIIQKRLFDEGADVQAGDLLYQIDPAFYAAAYAGAEATLARTEANLPPIRLKAERYQELLAINAISRQNYDDVAAALKQTTAEIELAKAAMETARINLAYTGISAPISGRIGKSSVTIGALAVAYQPIPFTTIQQLDPVYVDVPQASADFLRLQRGLASGSLKRAGEGQAKARLILEDGTHYALEGSLLFSDVTVDPSTSSFILRIIFPNPDSILLPGMYVRAVVEEGVNEQALLIPQQGVARDPKGNALVMLVNESDKVEQRAVILDHAVGNRWLVSEGLKAGDRVIVEGMQKIRPGVLVKAVPFDAANAGDDSSAPLAGAAAK